MSPVTWFLLDSREPASGKRTGGRGPSLFQAWDPQPAMFDPTTAEDNGLRSLLLACSLLRGAAGNVGYSLVCM